MTSPQDTGAGCAKVCARHLFMVVNEKVNDRDAQMARHRAAGHHVLEAQDLYYGGGHQQSDRRKLIDHPASCLQSRGAQELPAGLMPAIQA